MIKLTLPPKPWQLDAQKEAELVAAYQQTEKAVWREDFIREPLLKMTGHKCAYCERQPKEGGSYPTIDHIYPKTLAPEKVVDWNNLIPACPSCNTNKNALDTIANPILNPILDNPPDYLALIAGGLLAINGNDIAIHTITKLKLDSDELEQARHKVAEEISSNLNDILRFINSYKAAANTAPFTLNEIIAKLYALLQTAEAKYPYTAAKCTALFHQYSPYHKIKTELLTLNVWTIDLENLENQLKPFALC